jgi:hypothetical protein
MEVETNTELTPQQDVECTSYVFQYFKALDEDLRYCRLLNNIAYKDGINFGIWILQNNLIGYSLSEILTLYKLQRVIKND